MKKNHSKNKASESDLFQEMMMDVVRIKNDTAEHKKTHQVTDSHLAKQQAATVVTDINSDYLSIDFAPMIQPDATISFKRDGIQHSVFRRFKLGQYPVQAELDLHKKTLTEARDDVLTFIKECQQLNIKVAMIIHGKGAYSTPPALIKSHLANWLTQLSEINCAHSAQPFDGGTGAVYIMLKNSQRFHK